MPLLLLGLLACAWVDPDDCRVTDAEHCEPYRPPGLLCGLVHTFFDEPTGALCDGGDPGTPVVEADGGPCPDGFDVVALPDDQAVGAGDVRLCVGIGNAGASSADVAEVPAGAACGLNTTGDGGTHFLCEGVDPTEGRCPAGYGLRYTYDVAFDRDDEGVLRQRANLVVWCEVDGTGCAWGDCPSPPDVVCGLHGAGVFNSVDASIVDDLDPGEQHADLLAHVEADLADGAAEPGSCGGLPEGECPDGMEEACIPDVLGSTQGYDERGLCWCAPEDAAAR